MLYVANYTCWRFFNGQISVSSFLS